MIYNLFSAQLLSLLLMAGLVLLLRIDAIPFKGFSAGFGLGFVLLLVLGIAALIGVGRALLQTKPVEPVQWLAVGVFLLVLVAFVNLLIKGSAAPPIHQISTDLENPPEFRHALDLRKPSDNPIAPLAEIADSQRQAYPDIASIDLSASPEQAFEQAINTANQLGWAIHAQDREQGHIEATDTSALFGFVDDIAIRVQATGQGSKIDLRSISRVGKSDLGANAARIRAFGEAIQ